MPMALLLPNTMVELHDVGFSYRRGMPLFQQLHLSLSEGHVYGLLGKNGAGKSSLLKQITGLLHPSKGKVEVFGWLAKERHPAMLEELYVIPEEFELPPVAILTFVAANAVFYPKFNRVQFEQYLQEFEVPIGNKLSHMSYGQQKKFLISFGLATNVRLLILDEPTNGLDIPSKGQFRKVVASALHTNRLIIISTHQVRDLDNLIDTVLILDKGQVIFHQPMAQIAQQLHFSHDLSGVQASEILYSEQMQGKQAGVTKNGTGSASQVDLELLFNAVVSNSSLLQRQF